MSADGQGELEPEVPRKNVVGLFCGAAFHDVVFARVSGCDVVRLYDWELRDDNKDPVARNRRFKIAGRFSDFSGYMAILVVDEFLDGPMRSILNEVKKGVIKLPRPPPP